MVSKYILAIDQGTSATKAIIFNHKGQLISRFNTVHKQFYPNPGWVEHDPEEIYEKMLEAISGVLNDTGIEQEKICALSITNQRETTLIWDKYTGKPICNAVVWQCQRAGDICNELKNKGYGELVKEKTGLILYHIFQQQKQNGYWTM